MNLLEYTSSTVGCLLWEGGTFNVCLGTYGTERSGTVVEMKAVNRSAETFNAYMSHQAVQKSECEELASIAR